MENLEFELPHPYLYGSGTIILPMFLSGLPPEILVSHKTLLKKNEFHISLVCVKEIAPLLADKEQTMEAEAVKGLISLFTQYVMAHPIVFDGFEDELRHVTEEGNETIIIRCRMQNLDGFFDELRSLLGADVPTQPAHITLYTLVPDKGIGITSAQAMERYSRVDFSELYQTLTQTRP